MTAAQPPSWFEPEPSLLIGRAPAKAKPHWSDHSLSFPGRLEGTLHSWLVALNSPKKRPHRKFWGEKPAEKNCKSSGSEKERQLSWGWAQWRRLARCSRAASASPGTPSRSWARASSSARWEEPSSLRSFGSWSWRIWLVVGKYANSVYKSICDALTVKIGNFAMAQRFCRNGLILQKYKITTVQKNLIAKSSSVSFVFVAKNCATKYI